MKKWEYGIFKPKLSWNDNDNKRIEKTEEQLNILGDKGWEVVAPIVETKGAFMASGGESKSPIFLLKREKEAS